MKKIQIIAILIFLLSSIAYSQDKLTLEDIWKTYKYYPMGLPPVHHCSDDTSFLLFDYPGIMQCNYSLTSVTKILDCSKFTGIDVDNFISSPNESIFLFSTKTQRVRRSTEKSIFYEYSIPQKTIVPLIDSVTYIQNPTFSPDNSKICFFKDNNLFIKQPSKSIEQITFSGKKNEIINGMADWVNEEEFELLQAFSWSPDSKQIAYLQYNETNVPTYTIPIYDSVYPTLQTYKYPKSGYPNSIVTAYIYNCESKKTIQISFPNPYEYIPEFTWIDSTKLEFTLLNRVQNKMWIYVFSIIEETGNIVYTENNNFYVKIPTFFTPIPNSNQFIIRDGSGEYDNLLLCDYNTGVIKQVTNNVGDVTKIYGYFPKQNRFYFQATNNFPTERYVMSNTLDGNNKDLRIISSKIGNHDININKSGDYWIHEYSNVNPTLSICLEHKDSTQALMCFNNEWMQEVAETMKFTKPVMFKIPNGENEELLGYYILPHDYKKNKKYPVVVNVYGGPSVQKVMNEWTYEYYWYQFLAQEGYIVIAVDCRGTDGRGNPFRNQTYLKLGEIESQDFATAADYIKKMDFADSKNIAIQGWSYGGYISLLTAAKYPKSYKAVVSIAPVTDWKYYDNIYTERYMRTPQENPKGYENSSVLNHAKDIQAKILVAHGLGDDNVHPQNSLELTRKFIDFNIDFEEILFPNDEHSLYGNNSRLYLYTKIFKFYEKELK